MKINAELNAYCIQQNDGTVIFGFLDEDEEFCMPTEYLAAGYHYEKGGETYRSLCRWVESLF